MPSLKENDKEQVQVLSNTCDEAGSTLVLFTLHAQQFGYDPDDHFDDDSIPNDGSIPEAPDGKKLSDIFKKWVPLFQGDIYILNDDKHVLSPGKLKEPIFYCPTLQDFLDEDYYKTQRPDCKRVPNPVDSPGCYDSPGCMRYWKRTVNQFPVQQQGFQLTTTRDS
jgi:hypothetical protein